MNVGSAGSGGSDCQAKGEALEHHLGRTWRCSEMVELTMFKRAWHVFAGGAWIGIL